MRAISDEVVKALINSGICTDTDADREYVCECIDNIPTIEPKCGKWVVLTEDDADGYWKCSVCGTPTEAMGAHMLYNFCPFCGARMKGADDEV